MNDIKSSSEWSARQEGHCTVLCDQRGHVVAVAQTNVELIQNAPELYDTASKVLKRLIQSEPNYDPNSLLGQLKAIIARIEGSSR